MLMTQENQSFASQLSTLSHEKEVLLAKITELSNIQYSLQQTYRGLELERDDILTSYRNTLQDKKKLENDCYLLGVSRSETSMKINELYGQIAELKGQLTSQHNTEVKSTTEKSSLNKHIESLNANLVKYNKKLEVIEADNRRLMQDNYNLKQSNSMLNERISLLIKRSTNAIDNNKVLAYKLSSIESDRDALRLLYTAEKQKQTDLESLLHKQRENVYNNENINNQINQNNTILTNNSSNSNNSNNENTNIKKPKSPDIVVLGNIGNSPVPNNNYFNNNNNNDSTIDITNINNNNDKNNI